MKIFATFLLSILFLPIAFGQGPTSMPLKSLIETEQAFSKTAEERNTREAFMAFIADDGILFRPGAVAGKKWLEEHPSAPTDKQPLLSWQPVFGEVSESEDLGYTTGPWEFRDDRKNEKPSAFGDFVTIWKKQPDGSWKFALDLGISHPQSSGPLNLWRVEEKNRNKISIRQTDIEATRRSLVDLDNKSAETASSIGYRETFRDLADDDIRLYRNGNNPVLGKSAAILSLPEKNSKISWKATSAGVSRAGDLGYTYGTYEVTDSSSSKIKKGNFLHIWKKRENQWRLVLDVASPVAD